MSRFASVYPLVTARALARPFTYLADGLEKGSVVSVPFGKARRRGVVVGLEDEAPPEVEPVAVERVLGSVSPALVDLALWLADYYGSTPARALALVAPDAPARRKGAKRREGPKALPAEAAPETLTKEQKAALNRIVGALGSGGSFLLYGATGSGKTEVYLRACEEALARGLGAIVLVPEIALTPQALGRFTRALPRPGRRPPFGDDRRGASGRARANRVRRGTRRRRGPLGDLRAGARASGSSASTRSTTPPTSRSPTRATTRAPSLRSARPSKAPSPCTAARRLGRRAGSGWSGSSSAAVSAAAPARPGRGSPTRGGLSALGAAPRRARSDIGQGRKGDPPPQPPRHRAGAALPACGTTLRCPACDVGLTLHGDGALHCHHCGRREPSPTLCPACGAAELARLGAGTERLEQELAERLPGLRAHPPRCGRRLQPR